MPVWMPIALIGGSIGAATLVAISLVVNRKKTSAVAPNTEVVSTLAKEGAEIVETVGKQGLDIVSKTIISHRQRTIKSRTNSHHT